MNRNHNVTGFSRKPRQSDTTGVQYVSIDVMDTRKLTETLQGFDVVVSAYNAGWTNPNIYDDFLKGSKSIQEAVKSACVKRYIVIGGAGSLYVSDGVQAVDTPTFPKDIFPGASAARDYLGFLKSENDLDWAFFSPALEMHPGIKTGRTGKYRLGTDFPVFDAEKRSVLSVEDVGVVIADEIEKPKHHKQRFTAAY